MTDYEAGYEQGWNWYAVAAKDDEPLAEIAAREFLNDVPVDDTDGGLLRAWMVQYAPEAFDDPAARRRPDAFCLGYARGLRDFFKEMEKKKGGGEVPDARRPE